MAGEIPKEGVKVNDVASARDLVVKEEPQNPEGYGVSVNSAGELVVKPYTAVKPSDTK